MTCEYSGEWRLNNKHGWGKMKWGDGASFEGWWAVDQRTDGTMYMTDGTVYKGPFKRDRFDGIGQLTLLDGSVFQGRFVDGSCASFGRLI